MIFMGRETSLVFSMIELVIFDLDGTLLYTLDSITLSTNKVLKKHGLAPLPKEDIKRYVGDGVIDLLRRAFQASGSDENVDDAIVSEFRACFKDDCDYKVKPYNGMNTVLQYLKNENIKIACNSNKPDVNAKKIIQKHFDGFFDYVLGNVEEFPKKPDPSGAIKIMNELNVSANNTLYIGDSDVDVFTARNAGVHCVGAAWGYRGEEELLNSGAENVIFHPLELIHILKKM